MATCWVYFLLHETLFEAVQSANKHLNDWEGAQKFINSKINLKTHQGNLSSVLSSELPLPWKLLPQGLCKGGDGRVLK